MVPEKRLSNPNIWRFESWRDTYALRFLVARIYPERQFALFGSALQMTSRARRFFRLTPDYLMGPSTRHRWNPSSGFFWPKALVLSEPLKRAR